MYNGNIDVCCRQYQDDQESVDSISPDTIRLLKAIVVDFVTQAVQLSIVLREQELKLKGDTKAWRLKATTEVF
jgi:hypothetical protein